MKDRGTCITAAMKKDRDELKKVAHDYILTLEKAARDSKVAWEKEHKLRQEAEGELTILKGIETNRVKEAQAKSGQLQKELDRLKCNIKHDKNSYLQHSVWPGPRWPDRPRSHCRCR